ncbi:hypothetical protein TNCV_942631 [Trichonephila clavipes]|nr:hypothetical protein TNCV_942631 [Trichonephila clavipes]
MNNAPLIEVTNRAELVCRWPSSPKDAVSNPVQVDLVANCSSSLPSYVSPTALPLSEDPDGIFYPALD